MNIETITEKDAIDFCIKIQKKFKWVMPLYTRQDIIDNWYYSDEERRPSEEQINNILSSRGWVKHMEEAMYQEGSDMLNDIIAEERDK
jgi:hypothetical protein